MRRFLAITIGLVFRPVKTLPWRLLMLSSPSTRLLGLKVWDFTGDSRSDQRFTVVGDALALISRVEPRRLNRMRTDVIRLIILDGGGGEFWPEMRACVIPAARVDNADVVRIALGLVHETTHARLWRVGIRYDPTIRDRVERICTEAEVTFASHLPGADTQLARIARETEMPWWTNEDLLERQLTNLRNLGAPGWLVRCIRYLKSPAHSRTH